MKHATKNVTKLISLATLSLLAMVIMGGRRASALTPANIPSNIRTLITNYNATCGAPGPQYQIISWISPAGNPNVDAQAAPISVAYGSGPLTFQINSMVFVCKSLINQPPNGTAYPGPPSIPTDSTLTAAVALSGHYTYIYPITPSSGTVTGPATTELVAPFNANSRYWFSTVQPQFRYTPPGGTFTPTTTSTTIVFNSPQSSLNVFHGGAGGLGSADWSCVTTGAVINANSGTAPWGCPVVPGSITIQVDVPNTIPGLGVSSPTCDAAGNEPTTFTITSADADSSSGAASYPVSWGLQSLIGGVWQTTQAAATPNEFGATPGTTHTVSFTSTPSNTVQHQVIVITNGYGVPNPVSRISPAWGPCAAAPVDRAPTVSVFASCVGGQFSFTISSTDPDGPTYAVAYSVDSAVPVNPGTSYPGSSPLITPLGLNQLVAHTVVVTTHGHDPTGGPGILATFSSTAGPCGTGGGTDKLPSGGSVAGNCSFITVSNVVDPDIPAADLWVALYADAPGTGTPVGTSTTTGHSITFSIPASFATSSPRTFYAQALSENSAGASTGTWVTVGSVTVGPCLGSPSDKPPTGSVAGNCNLITASNVVDPDSPGTQLWVTLYADAAGTGTPVGTITTTGHSASFSIPASFATSSARTFYAQALSVNTAGASTGTWVTVGSVTVGPCAAPPPTCGGLTPTVIPVKPGAAFGVVLKVHYTGTAPTTTSFTIAPGTTAVLAAGGSGQLNGDAASKGISGGTATETFNSSGVAPGPYTVAWNYTSNQGNVSCSDIFTVPSIAITCGTFSANASNPAYLRIPPNTPFTVVVGANYNSATNPPANFNISVSPSFPYTEAKTPVLGGETDTLSSTGAVAKTYTVQWQYSSLLGTGPICSQQFKVEPSTIPYLGIYGGDAFAGGGFDGSACNTAGKIITTLNSSNLGAGDQMAAFALGSITNFNSAELSASAPSNVLSFANVGSGTPGIFEPTNCITAYPMVTTGTAVSDPISGWSGSSNYNSGGLTTNGGVVGVGQHFTVYVKGNLVIKNNIVYDNGNPWGSSADIPSATFIVQGNIYIDQSVTELDGTYVAEPDTSAPAGTTGIIDTCTNGVNPYNKTDLANGTVQANCSTNRLVVYGSFVAEHINWLRTSGDVKNAVSGENPYPGGTFPGAAEVIINGPESYMGQPSSGALDNTYDYYTSLPPVL